WAMEVFNFMPYTYYTRMTGGAGRKHVLILAVSCPAVISSGALNPPAMAHAEFHLHCHFERRAAEWRNLTPQ
ncbi:hypothetical protein, partial [uncultured Dialister sp.]|uniref:hypothetical protein n=1 Tax=uncultured Dialister sp. TaxID=278064 RepID=UPI0026DD3254